MAHLIDKDALVAEIERRIKFQQTCIKTEYRLTGKAEEEIILEYNQLLSFLNSLEVKEVDLEKEIQNVIHNRFFDLNGIAIAGTSSYATVDDMAYIAKHFFELGLRVNNEKEK